MNIRPTAAMMRGRDRGLRSILTREVQAGRLEITLGNDSMYMLIKSAGREKKKERRGGDDED